MAFVDLYADSVAPSEALGEIDCVDDTQVALLQALLPPGAAWPRDADAELTKLVHALSWEHSRLKKRIKDFFEELDPRTTYEMLEDWERVYGLPDECAQPTTLAGRRLALLAKWLGNKDPSTTNIVALALALGYDIDIHVYRHGDMMTCESTCIDYLYDGQWMFVWTITTMSGEHDAELVCALERVNQNHALMTVVFHEEWESMVMNMADGVFVTVSAPTTPPLDGPRPGASGTLDPAWRGIAWSPDLNSPVLIGSPGTFCLQLQ